MLAATLVDAAGKESKSDIHLVDRTTGKILQTLAGHKELVFATAFSPDGKSLYSVGGQDSRVLIWDVATGKLLHELDTQSRFISSLAASPDGRWLACWAYIQQHGSDTDIRVWDTTTWKLVRRHTPRWGAAKILLFSRDGNRMVSIGTEPSGGIMRSTKIHVWDMTTGETLRAFLIDPDDHIGAAALSADGRMLATRLNYGNLRLFELATGQERHNFKGHASLIQAVDFSSDGWYLGAASTDAPIYIWDVYGKEARRGVQVPLAQANRARLWQQLTADTAPAFQAVCELIARPNEAVPLLQDGWKRLPRTTPKQIQQWVQDLDSNQFTVRKNAAAELERFAFGHEELLRKSLQDAGSLEVRQRLELILQRLDPQRLRLGRMLEVLEWLGTPQARQFLQTLVAQTEDPALSREAAASLKRLER
jgi:WD40 repeat protein